MKIARTFNYSWFLFTVVATIVAGEFIAWVLAGFWGLRSDPFLVAVVCIGLSTAVATVLTKDAELK